MVMGIEDDRLEYTDKRLDREFDRMREDLHAVKDLPVQVSQLATQVGALAGTVAANHSATNERLDRMRQDQADDTAVLREDNRQVSRVLLGFLSALLVAMVGCIIAVIIVL